MADNNIENGIWFPPNSSKVVHTLRFLNVLDDEKNVISPTKVNVWLSNLSAIGAMIATLFGWLNNHMTGIETLWTGSIAWLTHSHVSYYNDKKQKRELLLKKEN